MPLSFAQQRLWFLDQLEPGSSGYNMPMALRLRGALDAAALEASLNEIIRRHEVLRTSFDGVNGEPVQVIAPELELSLPVVNLTELPESERETEASALPTTRPDTSTGARALVRASLLRSGTKSTCCC